MQKRIYEGIDVKFYEPHTFDKSIKRLEGIEVISNMDPHPGTNCLGIYHVGIYYFDSRNVTIAYKSGKRGCWKNKTTVDILGRKDQISKVEKIIKNTARDWGNKRLIKILGLK